LEFLEVESSVLGYDAKTLQKIGINGVDIYLRVGGKFIIVLLS